MSGDRKTLSPLVAGASAGAVESFLTYASFEGSCCDVTLLMIKPTEYVKTISQLGGRKAVGKVTPLFIIKETIRDRGIRGFYQGCAPVVTGNALKAGTRFFTYESIRDLLRDSNGKLSTGKNLLAGIGAGCIESVVAVTPSEAIKTRLIESQRVGTANPGSIAVIGTMIRTESPLALYRGLVPTMMKQSANSAVRFTSYQAMKDAAISFYGKDELPNLAVMGIGGLAGIVTVYATMPFDVVKTRMQQSVVRYSSLLDCFVRSMREEGLLVFWRGSAPRVARLTISGTVTFVVYENVLKLLKSV